MYDITHPEQGYARQKKNALFNSLNYLRLLYHINVWFKRIKLVVVIIIIFVILKLSLYSW